MGATLVSPIIPVDGSHASPLSSMALNISETAADVTNGNAVKLTGQELLILHNTDTTAHTVTIDSVPDALGREADIVSYSIPAGKIAMMAFFGALDIAGWKQIDGTLHVNADSNKVLITVLHVNA